MSAYHGLACIGDERVPEPQPLPNFPVVCLELLSAAVLNSTDLQISFRIYSDKIRDRFRIIGKIQLTAPGSQAAPHHSGCPAEVRYFFYTGNTTYGVQNLEYDPFTRTYLTAVYTGRKETFTNYPLFFIDATAAPVEAELTGRGGEVGSLLTAARPTEAVSETGGCWFDLGQTGVYAFGDSRYAFSQHMSRVEDGKRTQASEVILYRLDPASDSVFAEV